MAGLDGEIHCEEPNGTDEHHDATEIEAGVYEAMHTFTSEGDFHAEFEFMDHHGEMQKGDFHMHVAGSH